MIKVFIHLFYCFSQHQEPQRKFFDYHILLEEEMHQQEKLVGKKLKNFTFIKKLGEGSWATVYEAVDDKKKIVAIKVIPKSVLKGSKKLNELINTEISILQTCKNENVIHFVSTFQSEQSIFIATEYCNGGDLDRYISKNKALTEDEATTFLKQILNGFKGLHEVKAMHRDFKAPNVLLHNGMCKIADFGFAKQMSKKQEMEKQTTQTILGTSLTMAPEVLSEKPYGFKADIWSIGVVYYQTLYGKYPYMARTDYDLLKKIRNVRPNFSGKQISENAKDFISKCLTVDPTKRIDWKDIYEHPLIKDDENQLIYGASNRNLKQSIMENKDFYLKTKLPERDVEKEIEKAHSTRQIQFEETGEAENSPNMDKILEEVYGAESRDTTFQKYLKFYTKKRNDIMFVDKFICPFMHDLKKLKANHNIGLFIMSKKAFLDMKNFKIDIDNKKNIFNLKDGFKEFTQCPAYKEMSYQIKIDLEKNYYQAKSYTENIGLCSKQISAELNVNKVVSNQYDKMTNQIVNEYWKVLAESIGSVRDKQKNSLLKVLQALLYYKSTSNIESEEFNQIMANIDFEEAEKDILAKYDKIVGQ